MEGLEVGGSEKEREVVEIVVMLNSAAIRLFECSAPIFKQALAQLNQANCILKELLPKASPLFLWAYLLTQNNRAIILKATSNFEEAAKVLQKTIRALSSRPQELLQNDAIALLTIDIWLNYCANLSRLKKHKKAFKCTVNAAKLLERLSIQSTTPLESTKRKAAEQLAIAQYNMGVELGHLKCHSCVSCTCVAREAFSWLTVLQAQQAFAKSANVAFNSGNMRLHERAKTRQQQALSRQPDKSKRDNCPEQEAIAYKTVAGDTML